MLFQTLNTLKLNIGLCQVSFRRDITDYEEVIARGMKLTITGIQVMFYQQGYNIFTQNNRICAKNNGKPLRIPLYFMEENWKFVL